MSSPLQSQFVEAVLAANPDLSKAEIARLLGCSRQAVHAGTFDLEAALEKWAASGRGPQVRLIPARLEISATPQI